MTIWLAERVTRIPRASGWEGVASLDHGIKPTGIRYARSTPPGALGLGEETMGKDTKIEWADFTFNPWVGCSKVSAGCANCYAETLMDKRLGRVAWGPGGTRSRTSESYWRQPLKWDQEAKRRMTEIVNARRGL